MDERQEYDQQNHAALGMNYADTEVGNRDRFVDRNKDRCLFITETNSWVQWDGVIWKKVPQANIMKLADETVKSISYEARTCDHPEGVSRLATWAIKSQTKAKLEAMVSLAKHWPDLTASVREFDDNPNIINCQNGVVDLRTKELIEHHPSQKQMKTTKVAYDPSSRCPNFKAFLNSIFEGDQELISWMKKCLGYQLTGLVSEQVFFVAYGTGANGKSTLYETIIDLLGDYAGTMQFETILAGDKSNTRTLEAVGRLQGMRMLLASEVDSNKRLSEALIKQLTGGDTLTGAKLYGGSYEFRPQHKINLLGNYIPQTTDTSYGMERRIMVIKFGKQFTSGERDISLPEKLKLEAEGIFAWMVEGAYLWYNEVESRAGSSALGSCKAIDVATKSYLSDNDTLGTFLTDCTLKEPCTETSSKDLYECYTNWCHLNGETYRIPQKLFSDRLKERGYLKKRRASGYLYQCLSIKPEASSDF